MAGAYCKYCDRRCFVYRIVPDGQHKGWRGHMATCPDGKAHDRDALGGYDSSNSVNPMDPQMTLTLTNRKHMAAWIGPDAHEPDDPGSDVLLVDGPEGRVVVVLGQTVERTSATGFRIVQTDGAQ
jgi:hypothetical protein